MNKMDRANIMDRTNITKTLQKEYDRHNTELTRHRTLIEQNGSKKQYRKFWKHFHKRWEVERIAEMLNIQLKKPEQKIDYAKIWEDYQKDAENIKNFHIANLEKDLEWLKDTYSRKVNMRRA